MERRGALGLLLLLAAAVVAMAGAASEAGEEAWIRGSVLDPEGRPVPGAEVLLRTPEGRCRRDAGEHVNGRDVTEEDGRFQLPAPPGAMEIYVRHPSYAPAWTAARDGAEIRLEAACWIEGTAGTPATLTVSRGPWQFVHEPVRGDFRCGPLPAGILLSLDARSPTHRPFSDRIVLQPGETRVVSLALAVGARVSGSVFPPHAGAVVRAHGRDGDEFLATTAEDGTFTVTGLVPGWVRLVVISPDRPVRVVDAQTGEDVEVRWSR